MAQSAILVIGNEILAGHTVDANIPYLAKELGRLGLPVREVRVVADTMAAIGDALNALRVANTYVFTTGGIGPTHDDITAEAVAHALGLPCEENQAALARLAAYYSAQNIELNAARRRMARMPVGARLIENPVSSAPGFIIENIYVMAGVPNIMQAMFQGIAHTLVGGPPVLTRSFTIALAEGTIAADLAEIQRQHASVDIGSYPSFRQGQYSLKLIIRTPDATALAACGQAIMELCTRHGQTPLTQDWV